MPITTRLNITAYAIGDVSEVGRRPTPSSRNFVGVRWIGSPIVRPFSVNRPCGSSLFAHCIE